MLNYRCLRCGAQYERHFPFCSGCWGSGQLVPLPRRNRAEVDYQPGISTAREVMRIALNARIHPTADMIFNPAARMRRALREIGYAGIMRPEHFPPLTSDRPPAERELFTEANDRDASNVTEAWVR